MSWFNRVRSRGTGRRALAESLPHGPLRTYAVTPPPPPQAPAASLPLLALDLETTGLDASKDSIVSMGWVPIDGESLILGEARHTLVRLADGDVGDSAAIHGITDDEIENAPTLEAALDEVFAALTGRVLLAHHAQLETSFLGAAVKRHTGVDMPFVAVDTMELERRLITTAWEPEPRPGALRLWAARERYRLPVYRAHNALADALSCGELYLAQSAELAHAKARDVLLKDLT